MKDFWRNSTVVFMTFMALGMLSVPSRSFGADIVVSVISDASPGLGAKHGLKKVVEALNANGVKVERKTNLSDAEGNFVIVAGLAPGRGAAARALETAGVSAPEGAEALVIHNFQVQNKPALLIAGSDDRGLMYALLDVADRVAWTADPLKPFSQVHDTREKPFTPERALTKFVMNRSEFERYCFSEDYWAGYLDMLAANRFNTFNLLFGYFTQGYFEPIYPYMFDVEDFSDISVVGITKEKQRQNLEMLNNIIRMTHERGLDFTLGLWTHIHRTDKPEQGVPFGVTDENLISYTDAALEKFLKLVPGMDAIQFRVHTEAALHLPQQVEFWTHVFNTIKDSGLDIRVDMRAKGFTDDMIDACLATGVETRITTKYWGEQMGPPYHPTHLKYKNQMKRRHGYADFLRYPQRYKMHWRLWNHGTTRMFLWADPEYARRFAESTLLWDGDGFEVQEPLAMKMSRHRDDETFDLLKPQYQYYDWEYERYWHFYQVFGRLGYNPDTSPEVWRTEFRERFGPAAAPHVESAIHRASQVLPRIIAYDLPNLSADITWVELMRWHDLPTYINNGPIDIAQFVGIEEAARLRIAGEDSPRIWPRQTRLWFDQTATDIMESLERAETRIGNFRSKEYESTVVDMKILAAMARYHARRSESGVNYAAWVYEKDLHSLDSTILHEGLAIAEWEKIIEAGDGVYNDYLAFGRRPDLAGHWKEQLVELKKGVKKLEETRRSFKPDISHTVAKFDFGDDGTAEGWEPVGRGTRYDQVQGGYGWAHVYAESPPKVSKDKAIKDPNADFVHGPRPTSYSYSGFMADLPNGHYKLTFTMQDTSENPQVYGPMWIVANGMDSTGRFTVATGDKVVKTIESTVTDGRLMVSINSASDGLWILNSLMVERLEPRIAHFPVRKAVPGRKIEIYATVGAPDDLKSVRLGYGSDQVGFAFAAMKETSPHVFHAVIPAAKVTDDLEYFIEAVDRGGRRATYPRGEGVERVRIVITNDHEAPEITHTPAVKCEAGKALPLTVHVSDPSGVRWVRLRYRGVNQHQDYRTLPMLPVGPSHGYSATIPVGHIRPEWDLMYYVGVMDEKGNGKIHPDQEVETPYVVVEVLR